MTEQVCNATYHLVEEERGWWFWKTKWAIYRDWSYESGGKKYSGTLPVARYKTLEATLLGFKRLRGDK